MYFLDRCQPSLAWKYNISCSHMAQALHLHRANPSLPAETRHRRSRLFWFILIIDKTLSLRLGRASTIRDADITLDKHGADLLSSDAATLQSTMPKWIDFYMLQGRIYDDIFSPGALGQPESIRMTRARALARELQCCFDSDDATEKRHLEARRQAFGDTLHDIFSRADKVSHLATLTLLYRSIPASPYSGSAFCEECVASAHEALEEHQKCITLLKDVDSSVLELYVQWALLAGPFVPFIVLFCRVVETSDAVHLDKLASVIETLQMVPPDFPEAYKKQMRLFKVMYDVACRYVETKAGNNSHSLANKPNTGSTSGILSHNLPLQSSWLQEIGHGLNNSGDMYGSINMGTLQETFGPLMEGQNAGLGDWFDQNHQMFRMIEDDV